MQYPTTITIVARSFDDASLQMSQWVENNHPDGRKMPDNAPEGSFWQSEGVFLPVLRNVDGTPVAGVWSGDQFIVTTDDYS